MFEQEENRAHFHLDLTHFSDLVIPEMRDPYKWDIFRQGNEQAFHDMIFNANDEVTVEITKHKVPNLFL